MEHKEYNGWFNYETWLVNLWLSNDQDTYDMVRDMISDPYSDRAEIDLADTLKEYIEDSNPLADEANLFSDLINAAINEVNFEDIAEHWIEDYRSEYPQEYETGDFVIRVDHSGDSFEILSASGEGDSDVDDLGVFDSFWEAFILSCLLLMIVVKIRL
jgi:hypothetical protein